MSKKALLSIIFLFALSVIIRLPNINRPLSKHHEFVTAHVLCILNIWEEEGIVNARFLPKMSFNNKADKFINNYATGIEDKSGNNYYFSHPPLSYYLPYFTFSLLSIKANPFALQLFNLSLHFIIAVFIYLITQIVLFRKRDKENILPGIISATFYLFMPITLWFHSNVYTIDIPAQLFFTIAVFISLQIFLHKKRNHLWLIALFLVVFALNYSEWIGTFFTAVFIALLIKYYKQIPNTLTLGLIVASATSCALLLTIWQYAQVDGIVNLSTSMWSRFIERTGHFNTPTASLKQILINYATSFLPVILLIQYYLIRSRARLLQNKNIRIFLVLSLFPALLHHSIFFNFAGHDFAAMKSATFIAIMGGIVFNIWYIKKRSKHFKASNMAPAIIITLIVCIVQYYYINRPGPLSWKGDFYNSFQLIGDSIKTASNPDEVIFMEDFKANPQIVYYAGRNIKTYENDWELNLFLKKHNLQKAIIFKVEEMRIKSVRRISLSE